jgi:superfamily I DNA and/or RNA helicase
MKRKSNKITPNLINTVHLDLSVEMSNFNAIIFHITKKIQSYIKYNQIDANLFDANFFEVFPESRGQEVINYRYDTKTNAYLLSNGLFPVTNSIFIEVTSENFPRNYTIDVSYNEESDLFVLDKLKKFLISNQLKEIINGRIHLLIMQYSKMDLKQFELNDYKIDLNVNYNDDLIPFHQKLIEQLSANNNKGMALLYGPPGTGKTTYIRHLTTLVDKRFIYITPEMATQLSSPEFMKFLMDYPNSILVIEDAESILGNRQIKAKAVITNLLNLSDGILSDCLNIQIICTFNMDISLMDYAFLRKGRLIGKYLFGPLNEQKTKNLLSILGCTDVEEKSLVLSDIYGYWDKVNLKEETKIGFK